MSVNEAQAVICRYVFNNQVHKLVLLGNQAAVHAQRLGLDIEHTAYVSRATPCFGFRYRDGIMSVYAVQALGTLDEVKAHAQRLQITVEHFR